MATTVWLSYYVLRGHQSGERPRLQAAAESRTAGVEAAELDPQVRESDAQARAEVFEPADATANQRRSPSKITRSMHLPPGIPRGPIDIATARPARTPEQPEMTWEQASALSRELQDLKAALARQDVDDGPPPSGSGAANCRGNFCGRRCLPVVGADTLRRRILVRRSSPIE